MRGSLKLTANERAVLLDMYPNCGWDEEPLCLPFKAIHGVEPILVRRTVRSLARKGLASFHKGLWTDDGEPAGAGYTLTPQGRALADEMAL